MSRINQRFLRNLATILHTEASLGWGGQEIRVIQESVEFAKRGYRVLVACPKEARIAAKAAEAGLQVLNLPMRSPFDPTAVSAFVRIINREKIDIVHTHSSKDSWLAGAAGRIARVPVVRSRHLSTPVGRSWFTTFVYRSLSDVIITSGSLIKETLVTRNKLDPAKIVSIPAGVDIAKYDPKIKGAKVRAELGLDCAYPVVGCVAILRSWKGHRYLLEAVPAVVKKYPKARFLIVGNGPKWEELLNMVRTLNIEENVIMTGFRKDVPEVIAAMDIFVLPSVASEATSQVIPQALSMDKPVIATNAGGLPEIIENKVTGLLVPPKDPGALADAILWMAEHKEEARGMAKRGREKILGGFTLKNMIDSTEDVYRKFLEIRNC
jgi:glycosyltransferase involved in cell wall biosynthesis